MKIIEERSTLETLIKVLRAEGKTIGFVPTMGYLHAGHLSLMERARQENDIVIVSVFVNPTQFGPNEDFDAYPRNPEGDAKLMDAAGVDYAFMPTSEMLYPKGYVTYVEVTGDITLQLCGKSRPGHFKGVTTIVAKLFNLVQPHRAYFGQKDAQQVAVIRRMVEDLNMPVEIVACAIVREPDGLALSSRNVYLTPDERKEALALSDALRLAKERILGGERDAQVILDVLAQRISMAKGARIDYISVVDSGTLLPVDRLDNTILIALAIYFGKTRLIDNLSMEVQYAC